MPNIQAITSRRHANQYWLRNPNFSFAATDALAPLVTQELPKAMLVMPIGFIRVEDAYVPVAVQGLKPGKNLFVAANGKWLLGYIPAVYRAYPFLLANTEDGKQVLAFHEDSGLLSDIGGEPFFDADGQPAKAVGEILTFLNQIEANRAATQRRCAVLQQHDLIQPWPITLQGESGEQKIEGLYRIDETRMNQLPAEAFMELRDSGALPLAYCQLLSMQHLAQMGKLADAHAQVDAQSASTLPMTPSGDLDLSFLSDGGSIDFGGLY